MVTECPACQEVIAFEVGQIRDNSEVVCASCLTPLKLKVDLKLVKTGSDGPEKKILLCLEGEATRKLVEALLEPENFHLIHIPSEMEALVSANCPCPDIVVIDLDLSRGAEVDLCAKIRKNPVFKDSTLIVIGSMFEKATRYRDREPVCPGADTFIDRYYLQKELLGKIKTRGASHAGEVPPEEYDVDWAQEPEYEAEYEMDGLESGGLAEALEASGKEDCEDIDDDGHENARQLARDVISDMIRCNAEKIEEGLRSGRLYEFLLDEIGESRRKYETQVSETTRAVSNYFEEILEEKFKERKEGQDAEQPVEDAISSVGEIGRDISENIFELEAKVETPDFSEEPLEGFEATEIANGSLTEVEEPLQYEESPLMETSLHEPNLPELSHQEAVPEISSSPLSLDETPELEEHMTGIETPSLVNEAMDDDMGCFLVDEPTEALSVAGLNPETVQSESLVEPPQNLVSSGFEDATEDETPTVKTAKRLARIIVSDIVIYNEKKVEEGLKKGQFFELLSEEIAEGRQLYQSRVGKDRLETDYLQEALVDYVNKKTALSPG